MRNTISACLIEYIGENGCCPTPEALFDAAWPQYERKVDLTRSGRGPKEFAKKCAYTVQRFERGDIRGIETLEKAIEVYRRKAEKARPESVADAVANDDAPADDIYESSVAFRNRCSAATYMARRWRDPRNGADVHLW